MVLDFYYHPGVAPCRAVQMIANAVGVELNRKFVDLMAGEQLKPEYIKINPQHKVPSLVDNGFVLSESRAISIYLIEKYGSHTNLYPSDPKQRAKINKKLFFDLDLYRRFGEFIHHKYVIKAPLGDDSDIWKRIEEAIVSFDTSLGGRTFAVGEHLTIADIALIATISTFEVIGFDISKHRNVNRWFNKVKATTPGYEINEAGIIVFKKTLEMC